MAKTVTAAVDSVGAVLRFWRDVEIFNIPQAPKPKDSNERLCIRHLSAGAPLPWIGGHRGTLVQPSEDEDWVHAVYLGVAKSREWAEVVLRVVGPRERLQEDDLQRISGYGWLAAFVVTSDGFAVGDSLVPAGFSLAVGRLRQGRNLDGLSASIEAAAEAFKSRRRAAKDGESGPSEAEQLGRQPLGWREIEDELNEALRPFGDLINGMQFGVVVKSSLRKCRRANDGGDDDDEGKVEVDVEFLNSFYLDDLDRLIARADEGCQFGAALRRYLGPGTDPAERLDTLQRHDAMTACLSPAQMPFGRWPASKKHHLMLAQQAAVGEICGQLQDAEGLVAVNGPPGTGKTTLLCDVIAHVVVERATKLAALQKPWDAFGPKVAVGGMNVFPLKSGIVQGSGIVVASNNDAAVKNLTQELPALAKIAASEHPDASYFRQVAQRVFDSARIKKPAWGLIAGALGSKSNRRTFANALFDPFGAPKVLEPGKPCDIKAFIRERDGSNSVEAWQEAKSEFLLLLGDVERHREQCAACHRALLEVRRAQSDVDERQAELGRLEVRCTEVLAECDVAIERAQEDLTSAQDAMDDAKTREQMARLDAEIASDHLAAAEENGPPRVWDRWLFAMGFSTSRMKRWSEATRQARARRAECAESWRSAIQATKAASERADRAGQRVHERERERRAEESTWRRAIDSTQERLAQATLNVLLLRERIAALRDMGVIIPDAQLFAESPATWHLASAWVTPSFDELRAKLFLAGLRLHEATLLACDRKTLANMSAVHAMLVDDLPEPIAQADRTVLWDLLFFTVPVVSSTLASFSRLFGKLEQEDLGWLLIDEAGQATPQSVAGAMWRSRRTVLVGDPLQVEPVMTVPGAVVGRLRELHGVDIAWSPAQTSAQKLADRTMTLGAYIGGTGDAGAGEWTGLPLRAHRRCIDPMFGVANDIAYDGQMVQANATPDVIDCELGDSAWIDVRGQAATGPVVDDEMQVLRELLERLKYRWPKHGERRQPSTVFLISPFRKVEQACDDVVRGLDLFRKNQPVFCGTVHRFQGREAEVVFIVLGSAPGDAGDGSRSWASKKPNILNVALTRAKLRVYVIGNAQEWGRCRGFQALLRAFADRGRVLDARELLAGNSDFDRAGLQLPP